MMLKNALKALAIASASLILTGFVDTHESFTFARDGMVIVESRTSLRGTSAAEEPICDPCDHPWRTGGSVRGYVDGSDQVCEYTTQITFEAFSAELSPTGGMGSNFGLTITEISGGYRLQISLTLAELMPEPIEDDVFNTNELIASMLADLTADRAVGFTVIAPEITATDGTVNDDQTEATISIPLALLIDRDAGMITRFIEFRTDPRPFWQRLFR